MAIEFKYNNNGQLEAFEGEKSLGLVESTGDDIKEENPSYDSKKIKWLLKRYGASEKEIKHFMDDLENFVEEVIEDETGNKVDVDFDSDNDFENW